MYTVAQWIRRHARPLTTLDPRAPLTDLLPLRDTVCDATVVALGASTRQTHELSAIAHRILRLLVEEFGFRSLALEGDDETSIQLDEYVRTGTGDPHALLANARPFFRTEELLDVVRWIRSYNCRFSVDPVRIANLAGQQPPARPQPDNLADLERRLAENTIWWHGRTAHKIVYWGGTAHTVNGNPRTVSPSTPPATHRNAGSYLREYFGPRFVSVGLTFHHGSMPYPVPTPPAEYAEATLASAGLDAYLLDLHATRPDPVQAWLDAPAKTRLIGPHYDPNQDASHHLSGGSISDWFDAILHQQEVTPARFLASDLLN